MDHGTNVKGLGYIYDLDVQRVKNHWAFQNYKKGVTPKQGEDEGKEIKTPIEEDEENPKKVEEEKEEEEEEEEVAVEEEKEGQVIFSYM